MKFYCLNCGWNCNIELWKTKLGEKYVCKNCGINGYTNDLDAPKLFDSEECQFENESDFDFIKRHWRYK